jgi:DNA-binding transcriptional LysR family regulator
MVKRIQFDQQVSRQLRLRDLSVFLTVVGSGSMGKAAAKLGVSTPSVSEVIGALEHALGVRLLDRQASGVTVTPYGEIMLRRARAAFDELLQGVRDIEFTGDAQAGELTVGAPESITAGLLLPVLRRLTRLYPRVRYRVEQVRQPTTDYPELRDRKIDLVLARWGGEAARPVFASDEFEIDVLLDDPFCLVAGKKSSWGRRRAVDLADLIDAPFILPAADAWGGALVAQAFRQRGLSPPRPVISTLSIPLRNELVGDGQFVTLLTRSVVQTFGKRYGLKILPVALPPHRSPVGTVVLKSRTLAPAAKLFLDCARAVARSIETRSSSLPH